MHIDGKGGKKKQAENARADQDFSAFLSTSPEELRTLAKGTKTIVQLQKLVSQLLFALGQHLREHHNG